MDSPERRTDKAARVDWAQLGESVRAPRRAITTTRLRQALKVHQAAGKQKPGRARARARALSTRHSSGAMIGLGGQHANKVPRVSMSLRIDHCLAKIDDNRRRTRISMIDDLRASVSARAHACAAQVPLWSRSISAPRVQTHARQLAN